jgi:sigma-B regulation protein RsbU (phosphoserine phosphatase)
VNNLLCESLTSNNFVTAVYGVLDSKNHMLTFANCGHNLPVLLRHTGKVEFLEEGGQVFGITKDVQYEERPVPLHPGDIVVLYTDGVTEVFDEQGQEFGLERLILVLKEHKDKRSSEIQDAIHNTVKLFASPEHVFDDLTMIVLKRL